MVSGAPAFCGHSPADTMSAVVRSTRVPGVLTVPWCPDRYTAGDTEHSDRRSLSLVGIPICRAESGNTTALPRTILPHGRPAHIIQPLDPHPRHASRRLRHHRADRRRRDGAGVSGDGHQAETPGRDQDPAALARALTTDRLARFQREAEVLASLNHPHIAGDLRARRKRRA